jgi:tyrosyl-tRNA synthetase
LFWKSDKLEMLKTLSQEDIKALEHETWGAKIEEPEARILELLVKTWLAESNAEAKRLIQQNAISVNEEKINDIAKIYTKQDTINNVLLLRRGKKYKIATF